jgi:hypothetical protein
MRNFSRCALDIGHRSRCHVVPPVCCTSAPCALVLSNTSLPYRRPSACLSA